MFREALVGRELWKALLSRPLLARLPNMLVGSEVDDTVSSAK